MELTIGRLPCFDDAALACLVAEIDALSSPRTRDALFRMLSRVQTWREPKRFKGYDAILMLCTFSERESRRRSKAAGWRGATPLTSPGWEATRLA